MVHEAPRFSGLKRSNDSAIVESKGVEHPAEVLEEKIDWLEEIIARAKELKENGMHVKAIARRLLGPKEMIDWFSRGEYSRRNLIEAALRG